MPHFDIDAMSLRLAEISRCVAPSSMQALSLDGEGCHGADDLVVPSNVTLLPVPTCTPQ